MQHYHEALNNARKNSKDTWNLLRQLVPGKSKEKKCNFQNPTISESTFNFFATAGEKTYNDVKQRHQTNGFDVSGNCHMATIFLPHPRTATTTVCCASSLLLLSFTISRSISRLAILQSSSEDFRPFTTSTSLMFCLCKCQTS